MYRTRKKVNYLYSPLVVIFPYLILLICVSVFGFSKVFPSEIKNEYITKSGITVQRIKINEKIEFCPQNNMNKINRIKSRKLC
ncbi:hypothetical protein IJ182_10585 [bacterium]|nr:hypothetical protein [bacterium]